MSFIGTTHVGQGYAPGWFLVNNEDCTRLTKTIPQTMATTAPNGTKYVKMGTIYPSNDANAVGIVYEQMLRVCVQEQLLGTPVEDWHSVYLALILQSVANVVVCRPSKTLV